MCPTLSWCCDPPQKPSGLRHVRSRFYGETRRSVDAGLETLHVGEQRESITASVVSTVFMLNSALGTLVNGILGWQRKLRGAPRVFGDQIWDINLVWWAWGMLGIYKSLEEWDRLKEVRREQPTQSNPMYTTSSSCQVQPRIISFIAFNCIGLSVERVFQAMAILQLVGVFRWLLIVFLLFVVILMNYSK